jgi:hypothetical protein
MHGEFLFAHRSISPVKRLEDVSTHCPNPINIQYYSLTCRRMKTRCEYFDDGPCKLCAKSNRICEKAPPRRKRRKTTTRIADLEQRITSLTSLIDQGTIDGKLVSRQQGDSGSPPERSNSVKASPRSQTSSRPEAILPDVIDKGRVDKVTG